MINSAIAATTATYTPKMAELINRDMFGIVDMEAWFKSVSFHNSPLDLTAGLTSDAQAFIEIGDLASANQRLNRVKWIIANKLSNR